MNNNTEGSCRQISFEVCLEVWHKRYLTYSDHFPNTVFQALDAEAIRRAAIYTTGFTGPSGVDAVAWCRLCTHL